MPPKKNKSEELLVESKNEELVEVIETKSKGKGRPKKEELVEKPTEPVPISETKPRCRTKKEDPNDTPSEAVSESKPKGRTKKEESVEKLDEKSVEKPESKTKGKAKKEEPIEK